MDLYILGSNKPINSYRFPAPLKKSYLASVAFLNLGNELACGSPSGDVPIWDAVTGVVQQTLSHNGKYYACHICLPILLYPNRSPCTGYLRKSLYCLQVTPTEIYSAELSKRRTINFSSCHLPVWCWRIHSCLVFWPNPRSIWSHASFFGELYGQFPKILITFHRRWQQLAGSRPEG